MKIFKKDCIGRVPASIRELDDCALCENYELCLSLWGASTVVGEAKHSGLEREVHSFSAGREGKDSDN